MQIKEMLERANDEIMALRRANEILEAKVGVFEMCAAMVQCEPARRGYGIAHPDIAYEIRAHLDELAKSELTQTAKKVAR